jgi:transcriptional regulator with XRE-family HTH domain
VINLTTGERIRKARIDKGLTQKQLGELCGIAEPNIRKYELGTQNPKIGTVRRIADALAIDPMILITWESFPDEAYNQWLEAAEPIFKYLHSVGYTVSRPEPETALLGNLTVRVPTGETFLTRKDGEQVVFTKDEFEDFKQKVKESVDYLIWQKQAKK